MSWFRDMQTRVSGNAGRRVAVRTGEREERPLSSFPLCFSSPRPAFDSLNLEARQRATIADYAHKPNSS